MRIAFIILLGLHGLIHLLGFLKAFGLYHVKELTLDISRPMGIWWLIPALLFFCVLVFYSLKMNAWWLAGILAVALSQVLIICFWKDARMGTVANLIILLVSVVSYQSWRFERSFYTDVKTSMLRTDLLNEELLGSYDIQHLPVAVQKYLKYTGAVGKPKVRNMKVVFEAQMRNKNQPWFPLTTEQYNLFDEKERLFFMRASFKGLPTLGYHKYKGGEAGMKIKVLSVFPVVNVSGKELYKAETVTLLNDMCMLAPGSLIDERIAWEEIDSASVKAVFTNRETSIEAVLSFNEKGELVNFVSHDRYDVNARRCYPFSTPLKDYRLINAHRLAHDGKAIWHYPEGDFVYGRFYLKDIQYNVSGLDL